VGAVELDRMTWPDVKAEIDAGRNTVVVAFGATEQHGPHLPLATDALIGDHLARLVDEGGLHAGEWETSMLLVVHPGLVDLQRGEAGYTGEMEAAVGAIFSEGVHAVSPNGVVGDPARASPDHGDRYWDEVLAIALAAVGEAQ
jgi:creatinine amidohydrolase/Fe(II)-dependent formamide hydrolase-like protein